MPAIYADRPPRGTTLAAAVVRASGGLGSEPPPPQRTTGPLARTLAGTCACSSEQLIATAAATAYQM